jgi:hypothetical protein
MAVPTPLVEIGFDLTDTGRGPFFVLDNAVRGKLDNTEWLLGGTLFYDVTDKVKSISIQRGKNRQLDQFDQGLANVVFNNNDRTFDPEFAASPYFGQIIPKRQIRISSAGVLQFFGLIDDWNLLYNPDGDSSASAACSDATSSFATQFLPQRTNEVQLSGDRIKTILSLAGIDWPVNQRDIETGAMELGADVIPENTNALAYFRTIEKSEPGAFFISKSGSVVFRDRRTPAASDGLVLADDGTGIPYANIVVEYGSENLHNDIALTSAITGTQAIAQSADSINDFGVFSLNQTGLLVNDDDVLVEMSKFYANKFKEPEYRFNSIDIILDQRTTGQQAAALALELNDVIQIKFTPNGIAPAISKYAEIIRIDHSVDTVNHVLSLGFATLAFSLFVLDDTQFGKLDSGNALAF